MHSGDPQLLLGEALLIISTGGIRGVQGLGCGANPQPAESMFVFAPAACAGDRARRGSMRIHRQFSTEEVSMCFQRVQINSIASHMAFENKHKWNGICILKQTIFTDVVFCSLKTGGKKKQQLPNLCFHMPLSGNAASQKWKQRAWRRKSPAAVSGSQGRLAWLSTDRTAKSVKSSSMTVVNLYFEILGSWRGPRRRLEITLADMQIPPWFSTRRPARTWDGLRTGSCSQWAGGLNVCSDTLWWQSCWEGQLPPRNTLNLEETGCNSPNRTDVCCAVFPLQTRVLKRVTE